MAVVKEKSPKSSELEEIYQNYLFIEKMIEPSEDQKEELSEHIKKVKTFMEELIGKKIEEPKIYFFVPKEKCKIGGFCSKNMISLSVEFLKNKETLVHGLYHEFLHFTLRQSQINNPFKELPSLETHPFAHILQLTLMDTGEYPISSNFMEEGTADFFAPAILSKDNIEIIKRIFNFKPLSFALIKEVYLQLHKIEGFTHERIEELKKCAEKKGDDFVSLADAYKEDVENIKEMITKITSYCNDRIEVPYLLGLSIILLALEMYKREGKDAKQLLKDLILSPWDVVENVKKEIKNDNEQLLLQDLLFDISKAFPDSSELPHPPPAYFIQ